MKKFFINPNFIPVSHAEAPESPSLCRPEGATTARIDGEDGDSRLLSANTFSKTAARELAAKTAILVFCAPTLSPKHQRENWRRRRRFSSFERQPFLQNISARIDDEGVNFSSFARQRKKVFAVKILVRSGGTIIMKEKSETMKYDTSL